MARSNHRSLGSIHTVSLDACAPTRAPPPEDPRDEPKGARLLDCTLPDLEVTASLCAILNPRAGVRWTAESEGLRGLFIRDAQTRRYCDAYERVPQSLAHSDLDST